MTATNNPLAAVDHNCRVAQVWTSLGCHVVPWHYVGNPPRRRKKPAIRDWTRGGAFTTAEEVLHWWEEHPHDYPGVVTGSKSGVWVLDLDVKGDVDGIAAFKVLAAGRSLPAEAVRVFTPSGGLHLYFAWVPGIKNSQGELAAGIDVRGEGGYVAAGGAYVPTGEYRFLDPEHLPERPVAAPDWLVELVMAAKGTREWDGEYHREVARVDDLALAGDGEQEQALAKFLMRLHREGVDPEEATRLGWEGAQRFVTYNAADPWTYEDVQDKVRYTWARTEYAGISAPLPLEVKEFLGRLQAETEVADVPGSVRVDLEEDTALVLPDGFRASDSGNALRLVALADGRIRYVNSWGKWLVYSNGRWWLDPSDARVREVAKGVARRLLSLASGDAQLDRQEREQLFKFALRSEAASAIGSMVNLARGVPGVIVEHDDLDQNPWLLNCLNGTVDLQTGELRPHNPDDLLTLQCPVAYDPAVQSSLWLACVERWQPDPEVRAFLQRAVGSGATGHPLEALIVNVGSGSNGKSKFFGAVADVLGPFAVVPHKSLVVATRHEGHPTQKAALFRARTLLVPETGQGARLDEEQVKSLTGGDPIEARRMREDPWQFLPTHTAFMHTNYPPVIRGGDEGIWRRVKLVPWDVTIPPEERDERLAAKLRGHATGVLTWVVEGAVAWCREGLNEPAQVQVATNRYREENDTVQQFLDATELLVDPARWVLARELAERHAVWFSTAGLPGRSEYHYQRVTDRLRQLGAEAKLARSKGGRYWEGVGYECTPVQST